MRGTHTRPAHRGSAPELGPSTPDRATPRLQIQVARLPAHGGGAPEVGPGPRPARRAERERQVAVDRALVELVQHHGGDAGEARVLRAAEGTFFF